MGRLPQDRLGWLTIALCFIPYFQGWIPADSPVRSLFGAVTVVSLSFGFVLLFSEAITLESTRLRRCFPGFWFVAFTFAWPMQLMCLFMSSKANGFALLLWMFSIGLAMAILDRQAGFGLGLLGSLLGVGLMWSNSSEVVLYAVGNMPWGAFAVGCLFVYALATFPALGVAAERAISEALRLKCGIINHDIKGPASRLGAKGDVLQEHLPQMVQAHKKLALSDPALQPKDERIYERLLAIGVELGELSQDIYNFSEALLRDMTDPTRLFANKEVVSLHELYLKARLYGLNYDQRKRVVWTGDTMLVYTSSLFLVHALVNLLRNALQHSPSDSTVEVFVTSIEKRTVLIVRNAGEGVALQQQLDLFNPFVTYTEGGSGAGLGFVKLFMTQTGGEVYVVSTPGTGACFCCGFADVPARVVGEYERQQQGKAAVVA
ncbi:MAG: sensor histidine kinase [Myxococcota bacterium]